MQSQQHHDFSLPGHWHIDAMTKFIWFPWPMMFRGSVSISSCVYGRKYTECVKGGQLSGVHCSWL
eukprot:6241373-Amphidinium_carterae.1